MAWLLLLAVLSLTAYRATRLVTRDTFPPVLWLRDRLAGGWRPLSMAEAEEMSRLNRSNTVAYRQLREAWSYREIDDEPHRYVRRASWSPAWLAELITCPWCASAYVSGALVAATDLTYGLPVPWLMGGAVWALSALLASREWA